MKYRFWKLAGVAVTMLALCNVAGATVWNVSNVSQLNTAIGSLGYGDEVILAPGTYDLDTYGHTYGIWTHNVTIRGSTGNRDDVVLYGGGMNNSGGVYEGFQIYTDDVAISDLTLSGFYNHAIHFQPGADRSHINNVRTLNIGQQHMKGGNSNPNAIVGGIIENCLMDQTIARTNHPILNYTGGVDLLGATNWIVRDNVAMNIQGETGEGGGAIFLWQKIVNPTVERNVVIDCDRGIAMGNPGYLQPDSVVGGIVRNNFVSHANEVNMELVATTGLKVYNNTLWGTGGSSYSRCVNIYGTATSGLDITNNIIHGLVQDYGVTGYTLTNNVQGLASSIPWFVDVFGGDLHLTELAIGALDAAALLAAITDDIDGGPRPVGAFPDIGADEYGSPTGDANYDGLVDGLDYTIWSNNYYQSGTWSDADFSGDALVDGLDYIIWSNNYGFGYPVSPGGAIPEPACGVLLVLGILALRRRRA